MKRIKEFMKRAIREMIEDTKEIKKAWKGWTTTIGIMLFLLTIGWWVTG